MSQGSRGPRLTGVLVARMSGSTDVRFHQKDRTVPGAGRTVPYLACAALVFGGMAGCERAPDSSAPGAGEEPASAEEATGPAAEHLRRGRELFDKEDYDGAIAAYTNAIELDAGLAEAYRGRAIALGRTGDDHRAIADFTEAIRLGPEGPEVFLGRGVTYEDRGQYDLAIADYTKAIELKPDYAEAYCRRGIAYELKNEHDPAKKDLRRAIVLDPDGEAGRSAKEFLGVLEDQ